MEQLRKLGDEYHTEKKTQRDSTQKLTLSEEGRWLIQTTLQPLHRKQRRRKSHGHIARPDGNHVSEVVGRACPSHSSNSNSTRTVLVEPQLGARLWAMPSPAQGASSEYG